MSFALKTQRQQQQQWRSDRVFLQKKIRHKVGSGVAVNDGSGEQPVVSLRRRSDIRSEGK
eukprot:UN12277